MDMIEPTFQLAQIQSNANPSSIYLYGIPFYSRCDSSYIDVPGRSSSVLPQTVGNVDAAKFVHTLWRARPGNSPILRGERRKFQPHFGFFAPEHVIIIGHKRLRF
jgi:hypothetical protein